MGGDDIEQLAGEDGIDGLAVALGENFQGQDLEAGDADFEIGEAEEVGEGVGEVGAEGCFDRFLGPEVHSEGGQLSPRQFDAFDRVDTFQLADFHSAADVIEGHGQDLGGFRDSVGILRLEEEAAVFTLLGRVNIVSLPLAERRASRTR